MKRLLLILAYGAILGAAWKGTYSTSGALLLGVGTVVFLDLLQKGGTEYFSRMERFFADRLTESAG